MPIFQSLYKSFSRKSVISITHGGEHEDQRSGDSGEKIRTALNGVWAFALVKINRQAVPGGVRLSFVRPSCAALSATKPKFSPNAVEISLQPVAEAHRILGRRGL